MNEQRCEFTGNCEQPARYRILYDAEYVGVGALACVDHTAEARANDPLEYIVAVESIRGEVAA